MLADIMLSDEGKIPQSLSGLPDLSYHSVVDVRAARGDGGAEDCALVRQLKNDTVGRGAGERGQFAEDGLAASAEARVLLDDGAVAADTNGANGGGARALGCEAQAPKRVDARREEGSRTLRDTLADAPDEEEVVVGGRVAEAVRSLEPNARTRERGTVVTGEGGD